MVDSPASTPRVPAWKKLGLKLKYAKDEVQSPVSTPENASASKKRSRPIEGQEDGKSGHVRENGAQSEGKSEDKKSKKRKISQDDAAATSNSRSVADESTTPDQPSKKEKKQKKSEKSKTKEQNSEAAPTSKPKPSIPDHAVSTPIKTLKRKKSVSFTPDTKAIDGDQHLVKAWSSSLRQEEPSIPSSETTEPATSAGKDANKPSKAELKQAKKEAKRKAKNDAATSASTASTVPADVPPFVTYLQQYYTDRANWKFNKVKQGALFDNLFKIQRLPASYDGALRAYLEGLKGDAVRQRLQEQASEILEKTKDAQPNGADANSDTSGASSSSDSDSESSSDSSSDSDADADADSSSGSPTPSAATATSGDEKMALSPAKSAALKRQLSRSAARRREEHIKKDASGAGTSADQQLLLAQRCRAQMIVEVLGRKEAQLVKAQKEWEDKRKKEAESESSDESSVVSSSSEGSDSEEDSSSEDDSGSEDDNSSSSSSEDDSD
ncbi:uncharacterized protein J3D65DRAFT_630224 [Phyllosticta citribraziliensis]|uniref:WKF domain-containing protein n=1 Tax=Phyllosticta citribraziliensis TaxID=989973 RepID=A0ABR1LMH7_9PEZI